MSLESFLRADEEATSQLVEMLSSNTLAARTLLAEQRASIQRLHSEREALENRLADAERELGEEELRASAPGAMGALGPPGVAEEQARLLQALAEEERACADLRAQLGL